MEGKQRTENVGREEARRLGGALASEEQED